MKRVKTDRYMLYHGKRRAALRRLPANYFHSCVSAPVCGLSDEPDIHSVIGRWLANKGDSLSNSFVPGPEYWREVYRILKPGASCLVFSDTQVHDLMTVALRFAGFEIRDCIRYVQGDSGWNPIIVARKPLAGTVAENVLKHGTGALNIDACRIPISNADAAVITERVSGFNATRSIGGSGKYSGGKVMDRSASYDVSKGRWPSNVVHDGSAAVVAQFPTTGKSTGGTAKAGLFKNHNQNWGFAGSNPGDSVGGYGDAGSAARFFYSTKAKPATLARYLVRLVTPINGRCIDPFMGSGTTGVACMKEGVRFVGVETQDHSFHVAVKRIKKLSVSRG